RRDHRMTTRRKFITLLGGAAAWPIAARGQSEVVHRVGVLPGGSGADPEIRARVAAFRQGVERVGWGGDRNVRIDIRFTEGSVDHAHVLAKEMVALSPAVIFVSGTGATAAVQQETRTIPIVFANVSDPVGSGFVTNLARPNSNLTGFSLFE